VTARGKSKGMWDVRGNSRYYYRHRTRNGRRYRVYVGSGPHAERLAAQDAQRIAEAKARREERRAWQTKLQAADSPLNTLTNHTNALARAALLCAGYYQHYGGEWRRRSKANHEHKNPEPTTDTD
jgi:hypothetical protein